MLSRLGKWTIPLALALALSLLVLFPGCSKVTMVAPSGGAAVAEAAAVVGPSHDVAVTSLDFDPPLRVLQVGQQQSDVALLVAVDNKGTYTEQQVNVVVTLRATPDDEVLLQRRQVVSTLAPGQAAVVRYEGFPNIPARDGYLLTVAVDQVPGEQNLANNSKSLPLQLVMPQ
ncbi:MAG: hypothetical protein M1401_14430 [Chloroflexi bacterium]|nr:hypothetical protein [Chloroflexota bacterium]